MKLKYVIDQDNNFCIFSAGITHSSVRGDGLGKIVGAGFCTIGVGYKNDTCAVRKHGGNCPICPSEMEVVNVHCFGKSVSLGIESREIDEQIINKNI